VHRSGSAPFRRKAPPGGAFRFSCGLPLLQEQADYTIAAGAIQTDWPPPPLRAGAGTLLFFEVVF